MSAYNQFTLEGSLHTFYDLGNKYLAALTAVGQWVLRVDLWDWANTYAYAEYANFAIGNSATNYALVSLGTYSGNSSKFTF